MSKRIMMLSLAIVMIVSTTAYAAIPQGKTNMETEEKWVCIPYVELPMPMDDCIATINGYLEDGIIELVSLENPKTGEEAMKLTFTMSPLMKITNEDVIGAALVVFKIFSKATHIFVYYGKELGNHFKIVDGVMCHKAIL